MSFTEIFFCSKECASLYLRVVLASVCCFAIKIDPIDATQSVTPFGVRHFQRPCEAWEAHENIRASNERHKCSLLKRSGFSTSRIALFFLLNEPQ